MKTRSSGLSNILRTSRVVLIILFTSLAFTSFAQLTSTTTQTISTTQTYTGASTIITGKVTVSSGTTLTFNGSLTIGTGGTLEIQNNAKIIVNGTVSIGTSVTGVLTVLNGGLLTVNPGASSGTAAISINSTSATALDIQSGGTVIVNKGTTTILGLYETSSSNVTVAGALQIRGGGFKMDNTAKLTYSGSGNDTITGDPNATSAYFSNSTVLTVGPNVNLYIKGDAKNDSNANFAINGNVEVNGNYQSGNNTANVTGTGTFTTTGSLDADSYQGTVFGQHYSCPTGPCAGNNFISASTTTPCPTVNFTLSGPGVTGATYQWLRSSTSSGTFSAISGATTQNYTTSITTATYYKRTYTVSGTAYSSQVLGITPSTGNPTVYAGSSFSTCVGTNPAVTTNTSVSNVGSVLWTTSGTGSFSSANSQSYSTYTPSAADIAAGSVLITLTGYASGSCSAVSATSSYTLTINGKPAITTQPSNSAVTYCQNASATSLSVVNAGTGLTYQWYSNTAASTSSPTPTSISGATNSSYTPSTAVAGKLYYFCIVSSSLCTPSATSSVSGAITTSSPTAVPAIAGASSVCAGATTTLTNSLSGGTWSSANTGVATISSSGVVTGISAGTSVISYAGPASGCYGSAATTTITVLEAPLATTISSSGTYTVPANAKVVSIQVWGGGGGGSKGYTNLKGTGGGGGGYSQQIVAVNPGDAIAVTLGTGGLGATTYGNGNAGGTSSATLNGSTISATGGFPGISTTTPSGTGGLGGSGTNGSYNYTGGGGANITLPGQANPGGGGGGSAGTSSNGANAGGTTPGSGTPGASAVGGGGAGGSGSAATNGDGSVGGFPGGGGGGNAGSGNGGNGANGQVIITVYYTKIAYSAPSFCKSSGTVSPTVTGVSGGTYSAASGLIINSTTGVITPGTSTAGTYTVTYSTTCGVISSTVVTILATPTAAAGGSQTICQGATAAVTGATSSNGTIAWTDNGLGSITSGANTLTPVYTSAAGDVGTTVTLTMTVSNAACSATATYSVIVSACTNTWTGATSTAWNLNTNWSLLAIPTSQNDVVIPNVTNKPVIAAGITATTAKITINPLSSLTINSTGILNTNGSITNSGTFTANAGSTVGFLGTSAQTLTGISTLYNTTVNNAAGVTIASGAANAITIKGKLSLTSGALTTNGNLTIDIDAAGNIGYTTGDAGTVSGNVKVFRAINSITTHYISCPLDGVTANDLADDAQVINPATNNTRLFQFDNTAYAWNAVSSLNSTMSPANSYSMWFPATTTVDFTGTYTHSATYSYSAPNVSTKFMFVSNPYPSTLDWDAASGWTKTGVRNAVYFWNPTTNSYTSYVNGQGTNSATQYIPAMNSFFVAYTGTGSSTATVAMDGRVRTSTYQAMWRRGADETVRLTLKSPTASDETVIRFNEDASNDFDDELDAYKMLNSSSVPSIYTTFGTTKYSINSIFDQYAKDTIPVFTKIPADGDYVLSIKSSDPTIEYVLVDKKLGTKTVVTTMDYTFTALKTDDIARFELQMRTTTTTGVQNGNASSNINILSSPNGFLVKANVTGTGAIEILDATGNVVKVLSNVSLSNGNNFFAPEIAGGFYLIRVNMDNTSYVGHVSIIK